MFVYTLGYKGSERIKNTITITINFTLIHLFNILCNIDTLLTLFSLKNRHKKFVPTIFYFLLTHNKQKTVKILTVNKSVIE